MGSNLGVGFHSGGTPQGGRQYGLNLFGGKNAAFSGSGALNLGAYQGGYRNPAQHFGNPNFGGFGHSGAFGGGMPNMG